MITPADDRAIRFTATVVEALDALASTVIHDSLDSVACFWRISE